MREQIRLRPARSAPQRGRSLWREWGVPYLRLCGPLTGRADPGAARGARAARWLRLRRPPPYGHGGRFVELPRATSPPSRSYERYETARDRGPGERLSRLRTSESRELAAHCNFARIG